MKKTVNPLDFASVIENQRFDGGLPPVDQWQPEFCGDIDIRIGRDGTWYYMGSPINRKRLVRLFSTIVRLDGDKYFMVTPAEKVGIKVDDAPFVATKMERSCVDGQQQLLFETNVGDRVVADRDHPIRVAFAPETLEPSPYILVRRNLEALICRSVFYDMVDVAVENDEVLFLESSGEQFEIGHV